MRDRLPSRLRSVGYSAVGAVSLSMALALSGCAGEDPSASVESDATTSPGIDALDLYNQQAREILIEQHGLDASEIPDVDVVRYVSLAESATVRASCLTEAGFPAVVVDGGAGVEIEVPGDQATALGLADYMCTAQYPIDPTQLQPYTQEQKEIVADFMLVEQVECLASLGYEVADVPSRSTFLAQITDEMGGGGTPWDPYLHIVNPPDSVVETDTLSETCSTIALLERLYAD